MVAAIALSSVSSVVPMSTPLWSDQRSSCDADSPGFNAARGPSVSSSTKFSEAVRLGVHAEVRAAPALCPAYGFTKQQPLAGITLP